ncbi:MAG: DNA translocase FtsK 4TM domain-containing protein [Neisseriaceae bacterium]|nr:DNA translocase FtsK 4TM domain-containing protein [Neisseriaceae bacterium]
MTMNLFKKKTKRKSVVKNKSRTQAPHLIILINDALWLVALLVVVYLGLSLASFTPLDPAWSRSVQGTEMRNLGGVFGAYFADIMYYLAGISAWWLIIAAITWLVKSFRPLANEQKEHRYNNVIGTCGVLLLFVASPILEYLGWKNQFDGLPFGAGGFMGSQLGGLLSTYLGMTGTFVLSLCCVMIGLSLLLQVSWLVLIEKLGTRLEWLWLKLIQKPHAFIQDLPKKRITRRIAKEVTVGGNATETTKAPIPVQVAPALDLEQPSLFDEFDEEDAADEAAAPADGKPRAPKKPRTAKSTALPGVNLLSLTAQQNKPIDQQTLQQTADLIERSLNEFGVSVRVISATSGPVITRYEIEPAQGVKGTQIVNLGKDLARALALQSVRIVETIAGKSSMGIELPNPERLNVGLRDIFDAPVFANSGSKLTLAMGKDISGQPVVADLAKMPHVLVAGTTGSGKSVAINAMILSMLYKASPEEVRLIMVDPKMLELSIYEGIPHLLAPVVTDMKHAANALNWCVQEMEKRYRLLAHTGVRNLAGFNEKLQAAKNKGEPLTNPFSLDPDNPEPLLPLPQIVVIIDELADLMMVEGKKVEQLIARLAQKARAAGIHLILATQRPSVDVITGLIKANIPTRISFQVSSRIDSRTILDQMGAENLLGKGDMLFLPPGSGDPTRIHGAFVSDEEVHQVVDYLKRQGPVDYVEGLLTGEASNSTDGAADGSGQGADELFDQAVEFILSSRKTSISSLQRHLRIGYNRAANLMEDLERGGIVSAPEVGGSRQILARSSEE